MGELKFNRMDNKKYGTISITITNRVLPLKENFEIIANEKKRIEAIEKPLYN